MAIIQTQLIEELSRNAAASFQKGLNNADSAFKSVATKVGSQGQSNTYAWLGKFPGVREWSGARFAQGMQDQGYTLANKKYESTIDVERTDIEDDNLGTYAPLFEQQGDSYAQFLNEQLFGLLSEGFNSTCFDGENFFSTLHPLYEKMDGTGAVSYASNLIGDGTESAESWFLLDTSKALKPLLLQERLAVEFDALGEAGEQAFNQDSFRFGVRWRGSFGYGFWQSAVASRAELTGDNYEQARLRLRLMTADGNKKLAMKPTILVVSPTLEAQARALLTTQAEVAGINDVQLIVTPFVG